MIKKEVEIKEDSPDTSVKNAKEKVKEEIPKDKDSKNEEEEKEKKPAPRK